MLLQLAKFSSFLWLSSIPLCVCVHVRVCVPLFIHTLFIHSFVLGYFSWFSISTISNNAAMNIGCMYLFELVVLLFSHIYPGVDGSYSSFSLSFLRNFHPVFHSGCNNLHSHSVLFLTILSIEISFWPYSSRLMRNTYFFIESVSFFFSPKSCRTSKVK